MKTLNHKIKKFSMRWFRKKKDPPDTCKLTPESVNTNLPSSALSTGIPAPDFSLISGDGELVTLSDFRDQPVIIAFYPADWSPVCGDQMVLYNEVLPLFEEHKAQLIGISVDSKWCHRAFAEKWDLKFPLLADFEPKGDVAQSFGVYDYEKGSSKRALFVVDSTGVIHWSFVSPSNVNPGANGILDALETLHDGGITPHG